MLAPVSDVVATRSIGPLSGGVPVADDPRARLQRQLEDYNRQLFEANRQAQIAQQAARRQALQLQERIEATQRQLDRLNAANRQQDLRAEAVLEESREDVVRADQLLEERRRNDQLLEDRLRTDQLQEDRLLEARRIDELAAERLAEEELAADRLAVEDLNRILNEPQIRPPAIDATDATDTTDDVATADIETEPPQSTDVLPPLTPDDTGRLVNTLV